MFHTDSRYDEIYNSQFPVCSVPKSFRSFVIRYSERIQISPFLEHLFGGLRCLTLACTDGKKPPYCRFLSHCRNLISLRFYHGGFVDISFLRSMPHLKYLADFSRGGIHIEDGAFISRVAPNLESLTLLFYHTDNFRVYYEKIGATLCFVKSLMFYGVKKNFARFLDLFLSNRSVFRQVTSLRFVSSEDGSDDLDIANKSRPECSISQHTMLAASDDLWCYICWEKKTPNWTCPRCKGFIHR